MDDWQRDEAFALVREAVAAHADVVKLSGGPRSNEFVIDMANGRMCVVAVLIRDNI